MASERHLQTRGKRHGASRSFSLTVQYLLWFHIKKKPGFFALKPHILKQPRHPKLSKIARKKTNTALQCCFHILLDTAYDAIYPQANQLICSAGNFESKLRKLDRTCSWIFLSVIVFSRLLSTTPNFACSACHAKAGRTFRYCG